MGSLTVFVYVDGVLANSTNTFNRAMNVEGNIMFNDQDSVLGGYQTTGQYSGGFQDLRVYNVAKSASEVSDIYNAVCNNNNLILWYYYYFYYNLKQIVTPGMNFMNLVNIIQDVRIVTTLVTIVLVLQFV